MSLRPVKSYASEIRPELDARSFAPSSSRLLWLPCHVAIVVVATLALARHWVSWPFFPLLSCIIGASFAGLTFLGHETLHGAVVRARLPRRLVGWIGFLPFVVSPRLWIAWHNRVHHGNANHAGIDPDAYPTLAEYRNSPAVRLATDYGAPGRGRLRGMLSLLIGFTVQSGHMLFAAQKFRLLSPKEQVLAMLETGLGVLFWATLAALIGPLPFLFAFGLPLLLANSIVMGFILTNHSLSPLSEVNDPLFNSLTVRLPRFLEWLTLGFGFHVEHHLFPSMSARHARGVRNVLVRRWPERYQSLPLWRALLALHRTARVYKDATTLLDPSSGTEWPTLLPVEKAR